MSIVIIGGNCKMHQIYRECCAQYGCTAKVFTKMGGEIRSKIGAPDLMILFTDTVSHKMVQSALCEARRTNARVERVHSSSVSALRGVLASHCPAQARAY